MTKPTSGPWTYGFSHWGRWQIDSAKNDAGVSFHIAELASYAGLGGREKELNDQQEANARLIAMAPDQYMVGIWLDKLSLVIESAVRADAPSFHDQVVAMIKANRAAITRATET